MAIAVTPINSPNNNTNFVPIGRGTKWEVKLLPIKASVAMPAGSALCIEVSASNPTGYLTLMGTTNANGTNFAGILDQPIAATDSDYATAGKLKAVEVPITPYAEAEFAVGSGTFASTDIGRVCQFYTDSKSLAVNTNGAGAVITGSIVYSASATSTNPARGICQFNVPFATTA